MKLLYIGVSLISIIVVQPGVPIFVKIIFSFFPQILNVFSFELISKISNYPSLDRTLWITSNFHINLVYCMLVYCMSIYLLIIIFYFSFGLFITFYRHSDVGFFTFLFSPFKEKRRRINTIQNVVDNEEIQVNHQEISNTNKDRKDKNDYLYIQNVTRNYGDLIAVNNFTGEIYGGEIFCLLGHNGAGKTTLIKMISGIEDPDEGDIFLLPLSPIKITFIKTLVYVHKKIFILIISP